MPSSGSSPECEKMKRFFQKQPLRVKIMAGNLLLLVMFLCPSIMFYSQAMEETIDSNINYMNQINSQLNLNVEMIFFPLDRINYLHYSDGEMRRILVSDSAKKTSAQRFEDDLYLRNALNHSFRSSAFILRGAVINKYGDVYCSISSDTDSYQEYVGKLMGGFTWEGQNEAYLTGVHETVIQLANRKVITVLQRLYYYGSYVGVLSVDLNYDELVRRLDKTYSANFVSSLCMVGRDGLIYNSPAAYLEDEELGQGDLLSHLREEAASMIGLNETSRKILIEGKEYLVTAIQNEKTGWTLLQYVPMDVMNTIGFEEIKNMLLVFLAVLLVAVFFSIFLSRQTIQPLENMISAMKFTTKGHLKLMEIPQEFEGNEMGELLHNYNSMAQRINDDIDATYLYEINHKRMELKMLRYQINPHFMYNTLNTISALAEIEGVPGIVQMAGSLSKILYYNVKGKDVVLLRDEIEYMRNYLQIQDIRFPGRFHTKIEVPADVGNCYMLKFLIQPILENSISHGLSDKRTDACIEIRAKQDGEDLYLSIYDNGVGMEEEVCERWNRRLSEGNAEASSEEDDDNGIGLINVNARIKNFYGPRYGLQISSEKGGYTEVTLHLKTLSGTGDRPENREDGLFPEQTETGEQETEE